MLNKEAKCLGFDEPGCGPLFNHVGVREGAVTCLKGTRTRIRQKSCSRLLPARGLVMSGYLCSSQFETRRLRETAKKRREGSEVL